MARKTRSDKELHWREMMDRQAGSGLSVRQFCSKEGISQPSFYAWRKRFRDRNGETGPVQDLRPRLDGPDQRRGFIPVKVRDPSDALEVVHPAGCRIRMTGEVNLTMLRQVLDVLDEKGNG